MSSIYFGYVIIDYLKHCVLLHQCNQRIIKIAHIIFYNVLHCYICIGCDVVFLQYFCNSNFMISNIITLHSNTIIGYTCILTYHLLLPSNTYQSFEFYKSFCCSWVSVTSLLKEYISCRLALKSITGRSIWSSYWMQESIPPILCLKYYIEWKPFLIDIHSKTCFVNHMTNTLQHTKYYFIK